MGRHDLKRISQFFANESMSIFEDGDENETKPRSSKSPEAHVVSRINKGFIDIIFRQGFEKPKLAFLKI